MARTAFVPITMGATGVATLPLDDFLVTEAVFPAHEHLPPHVHDRATLAVMLEGCFDLSIIHRVFPCEPGSAVTEPAQERHGNMLGSGGARVVVIQPDPLAVAGLGACARLFEEVRYARRSPVCGHARRIARELRAPDSATPLAVEGLVLEMLALASRQDRRERPPRRAPPWLARARDELHARFRDPPRIRELAAAAGVHPDYLARAFRVRFGVPIGSYVRGLRLDWAATRLKVVEEPIARIGLEAGFADQSHFTRAFKRYTGLTPAEYRHAYEVLTPRP
jgi:AraC family transcriptional regulator